ncbi:YcgN family cysteine cluster protein [Hyphococcus sp. DH-69]|uniref:YcgN family cysteine cluster protein n=1 Tax=Hyphococcus formosus TaxID=3143534 RepID=UPI00398B7FAC
MTKPFWETKKLSEMTPKEWESLCDGCGRCCLYILHNEETGDVFETDVACKLFDAKKRRCTDYDNRLKRVPDCVQLTPDNISTLHWMPKSCAYRRLAEGRGLARWHPLVSGDPKTVERAKIAVSPDLIPEGEIDDATLESRITKAR